MEKQEFKKIINRKKLSEKQDKSKEYSIIEKELSQKFWYGNPQIELLEGEAQLKEFIISQASINHIQAWKSHYELENMNFFIWQKNIKNTMIETNILISCLPNKVSVIEFLNLIELHLEYLQEVRVWKSSFPNHYYVFLMLKSVEYCNMFYNTYTYNKISSFEDEYLQFYSVKTWRLLKDEEIYGKSITNNKEGLEVLDIIDIDEDCQLNSNEYLENQFANNYSSQIQNNNSNSCEIIKITTSISENPNISCFELNTNEKKTEIIENTLNIGNNNNNIEIHDSELLTCSICLEKMQENNTFIPGKITGTVYGLCGHKFHIECLFKSDSLLCPLCRYNLSPRSVSSCRFCSTENDLWVCLICGLIHCGADNDSNNHRLDHYFATKHQHCKLISGNSTYDFVLSTTLENYYKSSISCNSNTKDSLIYPSEQNLYNEINSKEDCDESRLQNQTPNEKVSYILTEYNSIISSQLESQRFHFMKEMKRIESKYMEEYAKLTQESENLNKEVVNIKVKLDTIENEKDKEQKYLSTISKELKEAEDKRDEEEDLYNKVLAEKSIFNSKNAYNIEEIKIKIDAVNKDISNLRNNIKEVKMNINLSTKLKNTETGGNIIGVLGNSIKKVNK